MQTVSQQATLVGQVALVTGAGRGIGRAIALALARAGADLVLVSRTATELDEAAAQVRGLGRRVLAVPADVSHRQDVQQAVGRGLDRFGQIDVLVNNAGVQPPIGPLASNNPDEWAHTIAVNLVGAFHCMQAVLPGMIAHRRGKIVNLAGGGAAGPRPNFSAYAVSKTALVRLTETLAEEVRVYNVQVNAIAPGAVNTRMLDELLAAGDAAGDEYAAARHRRAQGGTPVELAAELVVFLASEQSDGLTGKLISAPHDDWQHWDAARIAELASASWLTLRRMDAHTLRPLMEQLERGRG